MPPFPDEMWYFLVAIAVLVVTGSGRRIVAPRAVRGLRSLPEARRVAFVNRYRRMMKALRIVIPLFIVFALVFAVIGVRDGESSLAWTGALILPLIIITLVEDFLYRRYVVRRVEEVD